MPLGSGTSQDPWYDPIGGPVGGGGGNPILPAQKAEPWTNNVQADPYLKENIDWLKERRGASDVDARKQRAYGDIDSLAASNAKGIDAAMARRGISNSGISIDNQKKSADEAARAKVRAGMDIDASETARQDALVMGAGNIMRAPSAYALGQGQLNLQQMQGAQGQQNWLAQFQAQQQNSAMNNYMQMLQMFQNQGGNSGGGGSSRSGLGSYGGGAVMDDWSGSNNPWGGVQNDPWMQQFKNGGGGAGFGGR